MDKNNDDKINKVDKWNKYIANLSLWQVKNCLDSFVYNYRNILSMEAMDAVNDIYKALDEALDTFNELEDRYKSKEEALRKIVRGVAELDIRDLESELKQVIDLAKSYGLIIHDDRKDSIPDDVLSIGMCGHYYVLDEQTINTTNYLRGRCNELAYRNAKYAWAIKTILKKATFSPGHVAEELRFMARKSTTPKDVQERWEGYADEFLGEHSKLVDKINRLEKKIEELSSRINSLKCGEIKWVLREGDC